MYTPLLFFYDSRVLNSSNSISPLPSVSIARINSSMSMVNPKSCLIILINMSADTHPDLSALPPHATYASIKSDSSSNCAALSFCVSITYACTTRGEWGEWGLFFVIFFEPDVVAKTNKNNINKKRKKRFRKRRVRKCIGK